MGKNVCCSPDICSGTRFITFTSAVNQRNNFTVVFVLLAWMYLWNLTLFWCCSFSHHHCLKVDMFSYGMMLYELLTGRRPALGQHQLQIAKKLSKGIRPVLGSPEEVQFCCLHSLLTECWDTKPEKVSLTVCSRSVVFVFRLKQTLYIVCSALYEVVWLTAVHSVV